MPSMQTRQKVTAFAAAGGTALLLALMVVSNTESSRYAELLQHEGVAESFSGAPALKVCQRPRAVKLSSRVSDVIHLDQSYYSVEAQPGIWTLLVVCSLFF